MDYTETKESRHRQHIISVRINDEELLYLTRLTKLHNTTISELMRDALASPYLLRRGKRHERLVVLPTGQGGHHKLSSS